MIIKAKETEYKRVVFRSKGEAVFARALDHLPQSLWVYEPELSGFSFRPDFQWLFRSNSGTLGCCIYEYKPKKPTDTYIKEAFESFGRYKESDHGFDNVFFSIVYGDWFNYERLRQIEFGGEDCEVTNMLQTGWLAAREHRFDI